MIHMIYDLVWTAEFYAAGLQIGLPQLRGAQPSKRQTAVPRSGLTFPATN